MKGFVYYSTAEAERNRGFIDDLMMHAAKMDIALTLLGDDDEPDDDVDFILFRDRNPILSAKWESEGFRMINRSEVNRIANDKLRTFELASLLGVPAVPTKKAVSIRDILSVPVVLKTVDGHGGSEVFLCQSTEEAEETLLRLKGKKMIV